MGYSFVSIIHSRPRFNKPDNIENIYIIVKSRVIPAMYISILLSFPEKRN
ncbi:MAG: hypothetical protein ACTSVI_00515 [Promethearchaeota archaeon]